MLVRELLLLRKTNNLLVLDLKASKKQVRNLSGFQRATCVGLSIGMDTLAFVMIYKEAIGAL